MSCFGMFKPGKVANFRYHGGRHDQGNAPECLQRINNRSHAPSGNQRLNLLGESLHTRSCFIDGVDIFLKHHLLCGRRHLLIGKPAEMLLVSSYPSDI